VVNELGKDFVVLEQCTMWSAFMSCIQQSICYYFHSHCGGTDGQNVPSLLSSMNRHLDVS
jgi:hypothetical protein